MKQKQIIAIAGIASALTITGAAVAATHDDPPEDKKSQTVITQEKDNVGNDVTIESTPSEVIAEPDLNSAATSATATTSQEATTPADDAPAPAAPSAYEQFHQTIISQSTALAPLLAANDQDNFIFMQWHCLGMGMDENTAQNVLDDRANFLVPQPRDDGTKLYRYFTGACRVNFFAR